MPPARRPAGRGRLRGVKTTVQKLLADHGLGRRSQRAARAAALAALVGGLVTEPVAEDKLGFCHWQPDHGIRGPRRQRRLEVVLTAADMPAWCRQLCLDGDLTRAEPRTLRYRLLHTAGRFLRPARQVILRLPEHLRWSNELAIAYQRLAPLTT